jgi:hypothetical protein
MASHGKIKPPSSLLFRGVTPEAGLVARERATRSPAATFNSAANESALSFYLFIFNLQFFS